MESGFNAVIGQSGGPTAAINATLAGVIKGLMESEKVGKIYGMRNGIEGFSEERLTDLRQYFENEEALELLRQTPAAALGSCRMKITEDPQLARLFEVIEKYDIKLFFYIGGNDSMDVIAKLEAYRKEHPELHNETRFIGVPKTIDNDLCLTDHTPGFGSAAKFIACIVSEVARDSSVYTTKAVTILEIMGRDAGWLTAAALAKEITGYGADLIYLPESPFDTTRFLADVRERLDDPKKPYVVVAVSEGLRDKYGAYTAKSVMSGSVDTFGHAYLAGTGTFLCTLVREKIGCKCRAVEVNVMQRCAGHFASKTDLDESQTIGEAAVKTALAGKTGRMMGFERREEGEYAVDVVDVDIMDAANSVRRVPYYFISPDGRGISPQGIAYLKPLIAGEPEIRMKDGLPMGFSF